MITLDTLKNNIGKIAFGSVGSIIAVVSALFTLDARYAHAADVEKDKAVVQKAIQENSLNMRKQLLEDKLFELDVKKAQAKDGKLQPVDAAMQARYQRQLEEIMMSMTKRER